MRRAGALGFAVLIASSGARAQSAEEPIEIRLESSVPRPTVLIGTYVARSEHVVGILSASAPDVTFVPIPSILWVETKTREQNALVPGAVAGAIVFVIGAFALVSSGTGGEGSFADLGLVFWIPTAVVGATLGAMVGHEFRSLAWERVPIDSLPPP